MTRIWSIIESPRQTLIEDWCKITDEKGKSSFQTYITDEFNDFDQFFTNCMFLVKGKENVELISNKYGFIISKVILRKCFIEGLFKVTFSDEYESDCNINKTYQEWWIRSLKPMSGLSGRKNSRVAKPRVGSVGQTDHEWVSRI